MCVYEITHAHSASRMPKRVRLAVAVGLFTIWLEARWPSTACDCAQAVLVVLAYRDVHAHEFSFDRLPAPTFRTQQPPTCAHVFGLPRVVVFYINISRVCVHSVCTCVHVYQVEGMHYRQIWIITGNTVNILEQTKIVVYQWKDEPPHLLKTFCK